MDYNIPEAHVRTESRDLVNEVTYMAAPTIANVPMTAAMVSSPTPCSEMLSSTSVAVT